MDYSLPKQESKVVAVETVQGDALKYGRHGRARRPGDRLETSRQVAAGLDGYDRLQIARMADDGCPNLDTDT